MHTKNLVKLNYGQPKPSSFLIFPVRSALFNSKDFSGQGLGGKENLKTCLCIFGGYIIYKENTNKLFSYLNLKVELIVVEVVG